MQKSFPSLLTCVAFKFKKTSGVEESLDCLHEKENEKYKFTIAVYHNKLFHKLVVGHVPLNLSKMLLMFLQLSSSILGYEVTGKRLNRNAVYGLEISVTFTCRGLEKAVAWIQRKITKEMKTAEKWIINA